MTADHMFPLISMELQRARAKFPHNESILVTALAATEEIGEVAKALLQYHYEPHKGVTKDDIINECVQLAVMAIRIACDCGL